MAASSDRLSIFISYAREDGKDLALRLRDDLQTMGYTPWLDLSEIAGGGVWSQNIEDAIENCDLMIALMSFGSYKSEYCRAEQLRAIRKGKRIVPVLVQKNADRPIHLEHLNYLDFSNSSRYDDQLRDLLSDISAGQAFRPQEKRDTQSLVNLFKARHGARTSTSEKRDTAAFRRHIADLRRSEWLGSRYWWTYFLFTCLDIMTVVDTLKAGALRSQAKVSGRSNSRRDETVPLYFRPRTPETWAAEGIRPLEQRRAGECALPVYLLFDLEAVICQQDVRFSAGDPLVTKKTYATASAFGELPFEMIYHDSFVRADEREEVMQSRRAQVIVPQQVGLESLQFIWCRSSAEYETLRSLLPEDVWKQWRDKVTARTDQALFHRRWTYVENVLLTPGQIRLNFNAAAAETDRKFEAHVEIETDSGQKLEWRDETLVAVDDLTLDLAVLDQPEAYTFKLYLDDTLAYSGRYQAGDGLL